MRTPARALTLATGLAASLVLLAPWAAGTAPAAVAAGPAKVVPFASVARSKACKAGVKKAHGVTERTFCGPARVTVKVGGHTSTLRHGTCGYSRVPGEGRIFVINIGTAVIAGHPRHKPNYFGVDITHVPALKGRRTFTTTQVAGDLVFKGKSYGLITAGSNKVKAVLLGGGSHGTITETTSRSGKGLHATFHC